MMTGSFIVERLSKNVMGKLIASFHAHLQKYISKKGVELGRSVGHDLYFFVIQESRPRWPCIHKHCSIIKITKHLHQNNWSKILEWYKENWMFQSPLMIINFDNHDNHDLWRSNLETARKISSQIPLEAILLFGSSIVLKTTT